MVNNKYYLTGAFEANNKILKVQPYYQRENLVYCPEIISYDLIEVYILNGVKLRYYINSFGICFFICDYDSPNDFQNDINFEMDYIKGGEIYCLLYDEIINNINKIFNLSLKDVDWVMLTKQGELDIKNDIVTLDFNNKVQLHALIDCSLISEFVTNVGIFFKNLSLKESISRFEQYQISTYVHTLTAISSPSFFLTNAKEIEIYKSYYDKWDLYENIEIITKIADKNIEMFKFLSDFKDKNSKSLLNLLLSYISISLSYDSVIEFFVNFLNLNLSTTKYYTDIIFRVITLVIFILIIKKLYNIYIENKVFKEKTNN